MFYRYFADKEDLLAALAESFLRDVVTPSGLSLHLPDSPDDSEFFTSVVTGYWNMFKQNIGIMIAVAQLAATQQRFAGVQNEFRRFGMDIVAASVRRAQEQGYGTELDPEHTAAAIALLFENFTTVCLSAPSTPCWARDQRRGRHRDAVDDLEEDAVRVLSACDELRKESPWISLCPNTFPACSPRWTRSSRRRSSRWKRENMQYFDQRREYARTDWDNGGIPHARVGGPARRDAQARRQGGLAALRPAVVSSAAATAPTSTWRSSGNTWRTRDSACTTTCRTSRRSSATSPRSS